MAANGAARNRSRRVLAPPVQFMFQDPSICGYVTGGRPGLTPCSASIGMRES